MYIFKNIFENIVRPGTAYCSEDLISPPVFSGVRVTRFLVLYVSFVDRCTSFCTLSFGHCIVCSSSIYGFWLSLCYLQTLLSITIFWVIYENWIWQFPLAKNVDISTGKRKIKQDKKTFSYSWIFRFSLWLFQVFTLSCFRVNISLSPYKLVRKTENHILFP